MARERAERSFQTAYDTHRGALDGRTARMLSSRYYLETIIIIYYWRRYQFRTTRWEPVADFPENNIVYTSITYYQVYILYCTRAYAVMYVTRRFRYNMFIIRYTYYYYHILRAYVLYWITRRTTTIILLIVHALLWRCTRNGRAVINRTQRSSEPFDTQYYHYLTN